MEQIASNSLQRESVSESSIGEKESKSLQNVKLEDEKQFIKIGDLLYFSSNNIDIYGDGCANFYFCSFLLVSQIQGWKAGWD